MKKHWSCFFPLFKILGPPKILELYCNQLFFPSRQDCGGGWGKYFPLKISYVSFLRISLHLLICFLFTKTKIKNEFIFFCASIPAPLSFALDREFQYWRCWQETVSVDVLHLKFWGWRELFWISWIGIFTQPHHWIFFTL